MRGMVRDHNSEKVEKLSKFVPDAKYTLELVKVQLLNADSWIEAVKGCCQVYHIASPVPRKAPRDENEVIMKGERMVSRKKTSVSLGYNYSVEEYTLLLGGVYTV